VTDKVECECPTGPVGENTGTTCGCCGEVSAVFFDVFYLCERCRVARDVSMDDCEQIPTGDRLCTVMEGLGIDVEEAIRRLKLTPTPVWPKTAPCPCKCVKDVPTQPEDCGCCYVTACNGDDTYPLVLCRKHDESDDHPEMPGAFSPFVRDKHRCWQCQTHNENGSWFCPGCNQREWCDSGCPTCPGQKCSTCGEMLEDDEEGDERCSSEKCPTRPDEPEEDNEPLNRTYRGSRMEPGVGIVTAHRPGKEPYAIAGPGGKAENYDWGLVTTGAEALSRDLLGDVIRDPSKAAIEAFLQEIISKSEGRVIEIEADFVVAWFNEFKLR